MSYRDQTEPTSVSFCLDLKTKNTLTFVLPDNVAYNVYVLFSYIYQGWVLALIFTPTNLRLGWCRDVELRVFLC